MRSNQKGTIAAISECDPPRFGNRSDRFNDEANLNAFDQCLAKYQARVSESDKHNSHRVTVREWQSRPWRQKVAHKPAEPTPLATLSNSAALEHLHNKHDKCDDQEQVN